MAQAERRRTVSDVRALAALAHPIRVALLDRLMAIGPGTASECADAVGASASNCSWHLRQLARYGLVERAESSDGRERPWRAAATGFSYGRTGEGPTERAVHETLLDTQLDLETRLFRSYVRSEDQLDPRWREAANHATYGLRLTPDELRRLVSALDAAIRPYIGMTRRDAPDDAQPVHVSLWAFLHPDAAAANRRPDR
jgi:DNA-binding transcriptional ArsR family regulator